MEMGETCPLKTRILSVVDDEIDIMSRLRDTSSQIEDVNVMGLYRLYFSIGAFQTKSFKL